MRNPKELLAAARFRAWLVTVVEVAQAATRRREDEKVELSLYNPGLEFCLAVGVEQVVGRAAHVDVQLLEVQTQAGPLE